MLYVHIKTANCFLFKATSRHTIVSTRRPGVGQPLDKQTFTNIKLNCGSNWYQPANGSAVVWTGACLAIIVAIIPPKTKSKQTIQDGNNVVNGKPHGNITIFLAYENRIIVTLIPYRAKPQAGRPALWDESGGGDVIIRDNDDQKNSRRMNCWTEQFCLALYDISNVCWPHSRAFKHVWWSNWHHNPLPDQAGGIWRDKWRNRVRQQLWNAADLNNRHHWHGAIVQHVSSHKHQHYRYTNA